MIQDPSLFGILASDEEKAHRHSLCAICIKKTTADFSDVCDMCACPIDYVVTYKFKICPLNKWDETQ